MDKIEKVLMEECDKLENTYQSAEPGSDKEYWFSKAYDMMWDIYAKIGIRLIEPNAIPVLKIIRDSLNRVIEQYERPV